MATTSQSSRTAYTTNLVGDNVYDEARRACADLCRLARLWVVIAEANAEAMDPTEFIPLDEEDEPLTSEKEVREARMKLQAEVRTSIREHWALWEQGMGRAKWAVSKVADPELGPQCVAAKRVLVELFRIFYPPLVLRTSEKPGDHLLRPGGPIFWSRQTGIKLIAQEMENILRPLADFSDLMIMYDPSPGSIFDRAIEECSGWTVSRLTKRIGRHPATFRRWRAAASPTVDPRKKNQGFTFEELYRIGVAASEGGDDESGEALRHIAATQMPL